MSKRFRAVCSILALGSLWACECADTSVVRVGSKPFVESVVLGEITRGLLAAGGASAEHRAALGGTRLLWKALAGGEIDIYPEYTGTLAHEILHLPDAPERVLRAALSRHGVGMSEPLGFENGYALGMLEARARALGIAKLGDLRDHPELRFGFTSEFVARADGWPALRARYGLRDAGARGMDHELAYRGLLRGDLDVTDMYSTDPEISQYGLRVLEDDRRVFPRYQAILLYRNNWAQRRPDLLRQLARLAHSLDASAMRRLNAQVKAGGKSEEDVGAQFLAAHLHVAPVHGEDRSRLRMSDVVRSTREHLSLVLASLAAAILWGLPLGVLAAHHRRLGRWVLAITGMLQTLPALALLVFMIPIAGIGAAPAIAALFVYGLLPVVRGTHTGITAISVGLSESALALGLSRRARLFRIELPLAAPAILAGIKTSAVIAVGTATLGALVGAGGYGEPILTGIRLDDYGLILRGAIPAALMALSMQGVFDLCERWLVPAGLRAGTVRPG